MNLSQPLKKAMWARVQGGPFRLRDLIHVAAAAGEPPRFARRAGETVIYELKRKGAIAFSGPDPKQGVWALQPEEAWKDRTPVVPVELPKVAAEVVRGPYDPPPALEGPNSGLTEALAEFLWHTLGGGDRSRTLKENVSAMESRGWRRAAEETLAFLFQLGMQGPAGVPPVEGWTYGWVYEASNWEIVDAEGAGVALVLNDRDVPMMMAAPKMADAIKAVLQRLQERGGVKRSDIEALGASLPKELSE